MFSALGGFLFKILSRSCSTCLFWSDQQWDVFVTNFQWFWSIKPLIRSLGTQNPKRYNVDMRLHIHNFMFHYILNTKESAIGLLLLRRKLFFPLMWEHFKGRNGAAETEKRRIGKETARNCDIKGQGQPWKWGWKRCWVLFLLCIFVSCVFVSSCLGFKWVALDLKKDMLLYIYFL